LILETKIYPGAFNTKQFLNHVSGAAKQFGKENSWFIFLSGDVYAPHKITQLRHKYQGHIAFISWKNLLQILANSTRRSARQYSILVREFLLFANHYKLGRLSSMNYSELADFVGAYSKSIAMRDSANQLLLQFMKELVKRTIAHSNERAELNNDDCQEECPCFYYSFEVGGWHTPKSAYLFLNIAEKSIGVVLTGYQDSMKEKKDFAEEWDEKFKHLFKNDSDASVYTWIDEDGDEAIEESGYFKKIPGISGVVFNPVKLDDVADYFYWGYVMDFNAAKHEEYYSLVPDAFSKLLDVYLADSSKVKHKKSNKVKKQRAR
jgi:hypothetical protein